MKDFFSRLSWADYILAACVLRGLFVGYKSGIFAELLRSLAHLSSVIAALIFRDTAAQYLTLNTFMNESTARLTGFAVCFTASFFATLFLRKAIIKILKVGEGDGLQKILGASLGAARWVVLLSLVFMAVQHSPLKQLQTDIQQRSLTGAAVSQVAPALFGFTGQLTAQWSGPAQGKSA